MQLDRHLAIAQASINTTTETTVRRWYNTTIGNLGDGDWPWCAAYISYLLHNQGYTPSWACTASVPTMVQRARDAGKYHTGSTGIQPGDIAVYDWPGNPYPYDHVGVVLTVGETITAAEGNVRDEDPHVRKASHTLSRVTGYIRPTYTEPIPKLPPCPPAPGQYTVRSGDNLSSIARRHSTTVDQLVQWNKATYPTIATNPNLIHPGWVLKTGLGSTPTKTYTIQAGDTLTSIARRYSTTVDQLVQWNKTSYPTIATNPNLIHIGWVLRVS